MRILGMNIKLTGIFQTDLNALIQLSIDVINVAHDMQEFEGFNIYPSLAFKQRKLMRAYDRLNMLFVKHYNRAR